MGSSGSGAGGGSGGFGGGGGGFGSVTLRGRALTSVDPGRAEAWKTIQKVCGKLPGDYLSFLVSDAGVAKAYKALFKLHVYLVQDRSWSGIEREFGIDPGPGCLRRLAQALASDEGPEAVSPALQAPLKAALLDFLMRAVGDDPAILNRGDSRQVVEHVQQPAFARISNLFLGAFLAENLRLESKNLNKAARAHLRDFALAKADQIIAAFEAKFHHRAWGDIAQVSYSHLIAVMAGESEWTTARLRAKVKPWAP